MSVLIEASDLQAHYITQSYGVQRTVKAVDGISLQIKEGEILSIAGESGCGKSTLLKTLLGSVEPPLRIIAGNIQYNFSQQKFDLSSTSADNLREIRWSLISYIPQGSMQVLNPVRKIVDTFHDFISTHKKINKNATKKLAQDYLNHERLSASIFRRNEAKGDHCLGHRTFTQTGIR